MANHKKPTVKELDEQINETLKKVDTEIETSEKEDKDIVDKAEEIIQEDDSPKESPQEEVKESVKEEKEEEGEEKPKDNYKKRYQDSTIEAQVLYSKNKKMSDAIMNASEIQEPTEEELIKEFPEWEEMSDFERKIAKDSVWNKKKVNAISDIAKDFKDMDAWTTKIDEYLADPETLTAHPGLEDKEVDFKIFASKDTRRGMDFEDLTSSFLYFEESKPKPKMMGKMFETGSAGEKQKPENADGKIPFEEGQRLKISNYKLYIRYVKENKIRSPEV